MRIVLDTNTIVSALLWGGLPLRIFELAETGRLDLCTSPALYVELRRVLEYPKLRRPLQKQNLSPEKVLMRFQKAALAFDSPSIPPTILQDPQDDAVLACALAARADAVVTGDRHLLDLKYFQGIPIVTAAEWLARLKA